MQPSNSSSPKKERIGKPEEQYSTFKHLHAADLGSDPGTKQFPEVCSECSLSTTLGISPEHHQVWKNNTNKTKYIYVKMYVIFFTSFRVVQWGGGLRESNKDLPGSGLFWELELEGQQTW